MIVQFFCGGFLFVLFLCLVILWNSVHRWTCHFLKKCPKHPPKLGECQEEKLELGGERVEAVSRKKRKAAAK